MKSRKVRRMPWRRTQGIHNLSVAMLLPESSQGMHLKLLEVHSGYGGENASTLLWAYSTATERKVVLWS